MALSPGAERQLFTTPSKPGAVREAAQVRVFPGVQQLALASHCTEASVLQLVTPNNTQDILHRLSNNYGYQGVIRLQDKFSAKLLLPTYHLQSTTAKLAAHNLIFDWL